MLIYNVHTHTKTFALPYKEGEAHASFVDRVIAKVGLQEEEITAVRERKDGAGLVYEFEGGRWSLEDDDDLQILHSRLPPDSTPSATLHLNLTHPHAHFATPPAPPSYSTASSAIKSKAKKARSAKPIPNGTASAAGSDGYELGPIKGGVPTIAEGAEAGAGTSAPVKYSEPSPAPSSKPKSMMSSKSRHSKWGNDDAEPLGEVLKREWLDFQGRQGVRTVMGRVGNVANIRMLLKPGYRHVYVSRSFAVKNHLVSATYAMGAAGYTGLKTLGPISITVGSRTQSHPAFVNEEQHFDVVLGRSWLEKMGVKTDPMDQTMLTYMDTGEAIPCDLVVLKGADGNVITIT